MARDLFVDQLAELFAVACIRDLLPPLSILVT
jgi:hypothetical protein